LSVTRRVCGGAACRRRKRRRERWRRRLLHWRSLTMTQPDDWKVRPHGTLTKVDAGILKVGAQLRMPLGRFPRRMTVVRLSGSRLVVWSAIALDEKEMATL